MIEQISGWLVLMILTGIMTAKLLGVIDPFIPVADWHALARHIFVIVIWSSMTWSLRRFASLSLLDLFRPSGGKACLRVAGARPRATSMKDEQMPWYFYLAWFFAGAFLTNSIPHLAQGLSGNRFQTPFASPPGVGESSALVNMIWGFANVAAGGALLHVCFPPELPAPWGLCVAFLLGGLAIGLRLATHFSKVRNAPPHP